MSDVLKVKPPEKQEEKEKEQTSDRLSNPSYLRPNAARRIAPHPPDCGHKSQRNHICTMLTNRHRLCVLFSEQTLINCGKLVRMGETPR